MPRTIPDCYLDATGLAAIEAERARIVALNKARRELRERAERLAQGRALAEQMGGWSESAMGELAEVFAGVQQ